MAINARRFLDRLKDLKTHRRVWDVHYQVLSEFLLQRKSNFERYFHQGEFLNEDIFDSTGQKGAKIFSSTMLGMLWPAGGQSVKLEPAFGIPDNQENKIYYSRITENLIQAMDNPKARLSIALTEYMIDQAVFGTSGISVFEGKDSDLSFKAWGVRRMYIDEDQDGIVNTVYYEFKETLRNVIREYGFQNISGRLRDRASKANQLDEKVKILHVIEPREGRRGRDGSLNMPFASFHVEIETEHVLKESGFPELPVAVARFIKTDGEIYGRSLGMDALNDVQELNALREAFIVAVEKNLDPPLMVTDDGVLGSGFVDTSSGGMTVVNSASNLKNAPPVQQLFTVGELKSTIERIKQLEESVADHFMLDRLLDFNNENQMTLGEVRVRNQLRSFSINSVVSRQISELFDPIIERAVNILRRKGKLGVLPGSEEEREVIARGEEPLIIPPDVAESIFNKKEYYRIKYFTPAARLLRNEIVEGLIRTWELAGMIAQMKPEVLDNLDPDESIREAGEVLGTPDKIFIARNHVKTLRSEQIAALKASQERDNIAQEGIAAQEVRKAVE